MTPPSSSAQRRGRSLSGSVTGSLRQKASVGSRIAAAQEGEIARYPQVDNGNTVQKSLIYKGFVERPPQPVLRRRPRTGLGNVSRSRSSFRDPAFRGPARRIPPLTRNRGIRNLSLRRTLPISGFPHEAHLSAERSTPQEEAWLPVAHAHAGRSSHPQATPPEGSASSLRVGDALSRP